MTVIRPIDVGRASLRDAVYNDDDDDPSVRTISASSTAATAADDDVDVVASSTIARRATADATTATPSRERTRFEFARDVDVVFPTTKVAGRIVSVVVGINQSVPCAL